MGVDSLSRALGREIVMEPGWGGVDSLSRASGREIVMEPGWCGVVWIRYPGHRVMRL